MTIVRLLRYGQDVGIDSDGHQLQRCHYTNVIGHMTVRGALYATIQHTDVSTNSTWNAIDVILIGVLAI